MRMSTAGAASADVVARPVHARVHTALKGTDLNWAVDGRLVIVGQFHPDRFELATWRPGEAQLALRPYRRPAAPDGMLGHPGFLAW